MVHIYMLIYMYVEIEKVEKKMPTHLFHCTFAMKLH